MRGLRMSARQRGDTTDRCDAGSGEVGIPVTQTEVRAEHRQPAAAHAQFAKIG
jgi:hypothetical protein